MYMNTTNNAIMNVQYANAHVQNIWKTLKSSQQMYKLLWEVNC